MKEKAETQARRWVFTWNNPFPNNVEEMDIENNNLPIKEDYYSQSALLSLEETRCFVFKYVKVLIGEEEFVVKRPFFVDMEHVKIYFENLEHRRYCIFQHEIGEDGTEHLQGGIFFTIGKRFKTVKDYLICAHIEKAEGSNTQVRDYCTKNETRVSPPVEIGIFAEERQRTDYKEFVEMVQAGKSKMEISKLMPTLYAREHNKINNMRADVFESYFKCYRNVEVVFIYGASGTGKTTYLSQMYSPTEAFDITTLDNSMFTNYDYQDVLILDEFSGGLKLSTFNRMLDYKPFDLRGLGCAKPACYHKVFIISNYTLPQIIKRLCGEDYIKLADTVNRRIHKIIHFKKKFEPTIERETVFCNVENKKLRENGLTRRVEYIYDIDENGNKTIVYDTRKVEPILTKISDAEFPLKEETKNIMFDENGNLKF